MKKLVLYFILIYLFLPVAAKNKAILVGISDYPLQSGWSKLSSVRDVNEITKHLSYSFEVKTLVDSEATYDNIVCLLGETVTEAQIGDTVYIHFSCHGQQMISNDQFEVDCLDEALIPYDAFSRKTSKYQGEKHLKDDTLSIFVQKLRMKVGTNGLVIITLDSCHSDSMDRDSNSESDDCIYRGGLPIFGADHLVPDSLVSIKKKWRAKQPSSLTSDTLAHVLYLSACNSYERNKEIIVDSVGFGSLSYAISKAFEKYDLSNLYAWREAILDKMKKDVPFQSPQTRSSLSFDTIEVTETPIKISETRDSKITYIVVGVILTVLLFVLWIMKKVMK